MHSIRDLVKRLLPRLRAVVYSFKWAASRPLAGIQWLRAFRVQLWIVEGEEQSSHLPLSILCAVGDQERAYLLKLIFGEACRQHRVGRYWLWNLAKAVSEAGSDCAMIVVKSDEVHLKCTRLDQWFLIPGWLLGEVHLPYDADVTAKLKANLRRRIRRQALHFEVTRDPEQFEDFYHNMYLPYITQAFGACAYLSSYNSLKAVFESGELLVVKNHVGPIAGQLMRHHKAGPFLWELGIRDGNRQYVKDGVAAACHHFCLQYLYEQGYKRAFFGWSRTFLRDGVLRFKKTFSQRIVSSNSDGFALTILSDTPATRAFLCHNPFIFRRKGVHYAAVFADADIPLSADDIRRIDTDYFHPGLSRLFIYCPRGNDESAPAEVPAELSAHIELRCAAEVLAGCA